MAEAHAAGRQGAPPPAPARQQGPPKQPPCWYAVLGVAPGASAEEVRRAYLQAALRLHPDKTAAGGGGSGSGSGGSGGITSSCLEGGAGGAAAGGSDEFWLVQQAWEALQDPGRRAAYDRQRALAAAAQQVHTHEAVALEEMEPGEVEGLPCRSWPCRCGGAYYLPDEDAAAAAAAVAEAAAEEEGAAAVPAELAVPCSTCSLHICVLLA